MKKRNICEPLPENEELNFVGTLADCFSPELQRRQQSYRLPKVCVNNEAYRQKAGGVCSSGFATDEDINRVVALMYFLTWTRKVLKNYSQDIRRLYEVPLSNKCFGQTLNETFTEVDYLEDSRAMTKVLAEEFETGVEIPVFNNDILKLQKRLEALSKGFTVDRSAEAGVVRHTVTPIEVACLFRLRTLIKMSGSWLKKTVEIEHWMEKHRKVIAQHASVIAPALESCILAFNAVCVLGEIYELKIVDRTGAKKDFKKYLSVYDRPKLQTYDKALVPHNDKNDWVEDLMAKLNAHRTVMHIIGESTLTLFQIMLIALPQELLETTSKAIRNVASRLPSSFAMVKALQLSPFAMNILLETPPNSFRLSLGDCKTKSFSCVSNIEQSQNPNDKQPSKTQEDPSQKTPTRSCKGRAQNGTADNPIINVNKKGKATLEKGGSDQVFKKYDIDKCKSNALKVTTPSLKPVDDVLEKTQSLKSNPSLKTTTVVDNDEDPSPPTARQ